MEYVKQIDKYTLSTTSKLCSEQIEFAVDNMTEENIEKLNKVLEKSPTLYTLEIILMRLQHDLSGL